MANILLVCDDANLTFGGNTTPRCTSWQLLDVDALTSSVSTDITALVAVLESMFTQPAPAEIAAAFGASFSLPLICYVVASLYGSVIDFASRD